MNIWLLITIILLSYNQFTSYVESYKLDKREENLGEFNLLNDEEEGKNKII